MSANQKIATRCSTEVVVERILYILPSFCYQYCLHFNFEIQLSKHFTTNPISAVILRTTVLYLTPAVSLVANVIVLVTAREVENV